MLISKLRYTDAYWPLCTVRANTSGIHQYESDGIHGTYYMIIYDIVLTVDHTGLRAQIAWTEKVSIFIFPRTCHGR